MRDALLRLLGPEPDAGLVRRVKATAPTLTPGEVRASLVRLRISIDVPTFSAEITAATEGVQERGAPEPPPTAPGTDKPWQRVTLPQLVEAGLIDLPIELEHRFRGGPRLTARLEAIDRVIFDGQPFDSLSTAAGMARKHVRGGPPGSASPPTNGWTFWQVRGVDGSLVTLDALRRELHEGKVVSIDEARRAGT